MNYIKSRTSLLSNLVFIFILGSVSIFAQQKKLDQKSLDADLKYYYKISKEKNLSWNDRLYILNRIYEKYKYSNVNIEKLNIEIEKVKKNLESKETALTQEIKVSSVSYQSYNSTGPAIQPVEYSTKTVVLTSQDSVGGKTQKVSSFRDTTQDYIISAGDIMYISVSPAEELSKEVVVNPDGAITFPLIGTLKVAGLTVKEFTNLMLKNLSVYVANPKVNVTVKYFSKKQIFLMGEVKRPGGYPYKEDMRLLELISLAGGFTQYAGVRNIKIYRGEKEKQQTIIVNLEEILNSGDITKDFVLQPGDIVEVPKEPKTISVIGAVNKPGSFPWHEGIDILEALSFPEGPRDVASLSRVKIFRGTSKDRKVIFVNVNKLLKGDLKGNVLLEPGDVVVVPYKKIASGQWFVNTVLPWLTLVTMILVIISYTSK